MRGRAVKILEGTRFLISYGVRRGLHFFYNDIVALISLSAILERNFDLIAFAYAVYCHIRRVRTIPIIVKFYDDIYSI